MLIRASRISQIPKMHEWMVSNITELESELFGRSSWSRASVEHELESDTRTYVLDILPPSGGSVANTDTGMTLRGYAGFWFDGDDAELMTVGVAPKFQRIGIASSLLGMLISDARQQGARRMLLEVRVDNEAALSLYERFGFKRLGLRRRYYQPEGVDAYTMALDIVPHIAGFTSAYQDSDVPEQGFKRVTHADAVDGYGANTLCCGIQQYVTTEGIDDE